ncbi:MAG TPA: hypothetical protein VNT99_04975 [Methylomirabilota bacterium]|nr:hypothetical protein [Methylomirabilota bacterium]
MRVKIDNAEFSRRQELLLQEIAQTAIAIVEGAGVPSKRRRDVVETITFQITAIIDGSRVMDGGELRPYLTFADNDERTRLVATEGGSYMHELAHKVIAELIDPKSQRR